MLILLITVSVVLYTWYNIHITPAIQKTLWSYDLSQIDIKKDKTLIIKSVLSSGTYSAHRDLFVLYPRQDIQSVFETDQKKTCVE